LPVFVWDKIGLLIGIISVNKELTNHSMLQTHVALNRSDKRYDKIQVERLMQEGDDHF